MSDAETLKNVEIFKTSIIRIRDLLRSQGITGMDSMRHICLYLMSRYMTKEKGPSLGISDEFTWNYLMDLVRKGNMVSAMDVRQDKHEYALNHFYSTTSECVVKNIDRLFGTDKFPFDVKCPIRHKETLEILDNVKIDQVDLHMDVLGWVYEQHLKTGSSAARDLGQFFTDRSICTYMTELCRPGFKYPGVPESMCDPSMGTGGFQAAYMKYYKRPDSEPVDWKVQHTEIHGCDTDQKVAGLARLNLFIESGGALFTHLEHRDSLYGDLPQTGYDVILANMPFGLKGLKHADCCDRVKALKINGTKSEPLFLQLMMVSLNMGGRCAVVVPDGMLVNSSVCHNGTRKYLLDHFELKRVIKMTGKFFMNTGIQPSILFFENTGKPTATVEFWDVVSDGKGVMTETMVLSVPRASLDEACVLDVRRYQEVKEVANPAGFPMVKLGDVCDLLSGKTNNERGTGDIPFYDSNGQIAVVNKHLFEGDYIITARVLSIGSFHLVSGKFWAGDNTINMKIKEGSNTNIRYLFYWLKLNANKFQNIKSGIIPKIRKSDVAEITVPLPPLPIQAEIVATLDRIYAPGTTELADTLKMTDRAMDLVLAQPSGATLEPIVEAQRLIRKSAQMVADVKAQMVAIVKSVGGRGFPMATMKEVCQVSFGERITQKEHAGTIYPVYGSGGDTFRTDRYNRTGRTCKVGRFAISEPNMVMFVTGPYWLMDSGFTVESKQPDRITTDYLWYCLMMDKTNLVTLSTGSCQKNIDMNAFYQVAYPCPPLAFQHALVARLDALQAQRAALESLQRQSEDNARFILESYLHTAEPLREASSSEDDEKEEPRIIRRPRSVSPLRAAESGNACAAVAAVAIPDYASMSLAALKDLCKERGIRGISGKKKEELVVILRDLS